MRTATRVEFDNPPGGGNGPNRFTLDVVLSMQSDGFWRPSLLPKQDDAYL